MSLTDKVVLLTGACSGIGTATAEIFIQHGAKLVLVGRNVENLTTTERRCKSANNNLECLVIAGDIIEDAAEIINKTLKHFGRLDVLVNYAGILSTGGILDTDLAEFDHVLNSNLRAVFLLTKLAINHLIATQGNIINVSCAHGSRPNPSSLCYSVSKAALDQFTQCISLELATKNVRVSTIDPSITLSDLQKRKSSQEEEPKHLPIRQAKDTNFGDIDEVAKAIVYLASDGKAFET